MIRIAICDDELHQLNETFDIVHNIVINNNINADIKKFTSSHELLDLINNREAHFDILFLDIIMDSLDGISLAKEVRKISSEVNIIFTTTSKDFLLDGYDVNPIHYLLKPLSKIKVEEALTKSINLINEKRENFIVIKNGATISKYYLSDIAFFESNLRQIIINKKDGSKIIFYEKLDYIEKSISVDFFIRCHKSYLVNMYCISSIDGASIFMNNGEELPISRQYLKKTKDSFLDFFCNRL